MPTSKRQRQRDSHQARLAAIEARRRKQQRKKLGIVIFTVVLLVLGVSAFVAGGGGNGTQVETASDSTAAPGTTGAPAVLTSVPPGASVTGDTPCPKADGTSERTTTFAKPPPMCIDPARTYNAEVTTTKGRFTIALDAKAAPKTVNNFVVLARYKFFEGIAFHRIIPGFVVQGGDPQANGLGGPGYRFEDELPKTPYQVGSVAMANSSTPNTNGSQFFVVTGPAGASLPPQYSLFGTVTDGMDIVKSIEAVGTPATATDPGGKPTQVVTISSVQIKET